jgi:hypothetical protein
VFGADTIRLLIGRFLVGGCSQGSVRLGTNYVGLDWISAAAPLRSDYRTSRTDGLTGV